MILKLVLAPVKTWVKTKILSVVAQNNAPLPVVAQKYLPYLPASDSFVIPKAPDPAYETCGLGLPVPPKELWVGYGRSREEYLSWGAEDVGKMLDVIKTSDFSLAPGSHILDFGCGAGRMLRHLKGIAEDCEVWGAEISAEHIYWCKRHLDPPFHFATTTTIPHLPWEDGYFDFIYTGSVFTHIDDLAEAWLLELRRILAPSGRLYITIHDNHTMQLLDTTHQETSLSQHMRSHGLYNAVKDDFGMLVIGRDTNSIVFYDIEYFCKTLEAMYRILSVTQAAYSYYQSAVLLTRK